MQNKFDNLVNRKGTNCSKWDELTEVFGSDDLIPMWVADSDWPTAESVINSLKKRVEHGIIGYTFPGEELNSVIINWIKKRHHWEIKKEWIVHTGGVVPSINIALQTFTNPGDEVIIQSPVYYPFFTAIRNNGCHILNNQLQWDGEKYVIDYDNLETVLQRKNSRLKGPARPKIFILCNPHNPVGRVWKEDELKKIGDICQKNNVLIISDEIHADFIFFDNKHIVFPSVKEDFAYNSITLFSPSKTFNIAGLNGSIAIIPDKNIRNDFKNRCQGIMNTNTLSLTAMEAAYRDGEEWLDAQLDYLAENLVYATDFINNNIKGINTYLPEGTYLLWIDFKKMGFEQEKLNSFLINKAKIALDTGTWFGPGGEGYMRLNVACPRNLLKKGLMRIYEAVRKELSEDNG